MTPDPVPLDELERLRAEMHKAEQAFDNNEGIETWRIYVSAESEWDRAINAQFPALIAELRRARGEIDGLRVLVESLGGPMRNPPTGPVYGKSPVTEFEEAVNAALADLEEIARGAHREG